MIVFDTTLWQIALAVVVYMIVGATWYSPALFANAWMEAVGKPKGAPMGDNYIYLGAVFGELMAVLGLAYIGQLIGATSWMAGATLGALVWLFFVVSTALVNSTFQGKPLKLYLIDMGYHFVGLVLAGAIIGL
jgi:hypothetical protein